MEFVAELASYVGLSPSLLQFLLCLFASLPVSFFHRFIPTTHGRNAYAFVSGAILCWIAYGTESLHYFLFPLVFTYASLLVYRRWCGYITFAAVFVYLARCHVINMSGNKWRTGGIDCTGTLMVLTLKVVSVAVDYQDSLIPADKASHAMYRNRLSDLPGPLEFLGYVFCCGSVLVGPLYNFKSYQGFVQRTLEWSQSGSEKRLPSPWGKVGQKLLRALFCLVFYQTLGPLVPVSFFSDPRYAQLPLLYRVAYVFAVSTNFRFSYYFIWSIAESALVLSGLGFTGWDSKDPSKALWDRAVNFDILKMEFAWSAALLPAFWNMSVGNWLRTYVYERLQAASKSSSVFNLLATQVISALWHGLYPGYYLFFINAAIGQSASRVLYKFQLAIPESRVGLRRASYFAHYLCTMLLLNYSEIGFVLLAADKTAVVWRSLYFSGTILPVVIAFGLVFLVPKKKKVQKKES